MATMNASTQASKQAPASIPIAAPPFSERELEVVGTLPATPFSPEYAVRDHPVSPREAAIAFYRRKPVWQLVGPETLVFTPRIIPDNVARGFVFEGRPFDPVAEGGGLDMFGVEWVFEPEVGGSMEIPGLIMLEDVADWRDVLVFPDVDSWDWEGSAAENNGSYLVPDVCAKWWMQTGWFERLISFMTFEEAAVAMLDDDIEDDLIALFSALSDTYIDIIDHVVRYYDYVDVFYIHDDWGSAKNTFFSPERARELIVPAMRKVTDHIHDIGYYAELHSCGHNARQIPNYIAAGWDCWVPQTDVNDARAYYEEFGDQILFGVPPLAFDPETTSEEDQRRLAVEYAEKYCDPAKPSSLDAFAFPKQMTPAFLEELYRQSRMRYAAGADS